MPKRRRNEPAFDAETWLDMDQPSSDDRLELEHEAELARRESDHESYLDSLVNGTY